MDHVGILEAAYHMDDGVHLTDIGQELVSQALALGGALYEACDIHEFDDRRSGLFRMIKVCQQL